MANYIAALDQGTTSTRCILFDTAGIIVASHQKEHRQIYPQPGWVEHDPAEIWQSTQEVIAGCLKKASVQGSQIAALGITNQRETTLLWNAETGASYGNAIVWQDLRTAERVEELIASMGKDALREKTGLPFAAYFSATKLEWLLNRYPEAREDAEKGRVRFGTIDSYLCWQLSGGTGRQGDARSPSSSAGESPGPSPSEGVHISDSSNASRTLLMNLADRQWDSELLELFSVPRSILPEIKPSIPSSPFAYTSTSGPFGARIPIAAILGDQQAALFGQTCFNAGEAKNTYGTGCFLLMNTGQELKQSKHGLLSTLAYQFGNEPAHYALEGSVAVAGALVQWLRDNLGLIKQSSDIEALARSVSDSGDVYFVPAFSGLYAPHWQSDARGLIAGLTGFAGAGHLARSVLEATAFQSLEIMEAMKSDAGAAPARTGFQFSELKVDGGMVVNELLMQFQADMLGIPVIRPRITETTALGAAYAAGLAVGFWKDRETLRSQWMQDAQWTPQMSERLRESKLQKWYKAVERSKGWID